MDVSESRLRREVAQAQQTQKEREQAHSRELDGVRDSYKRQLADLDESHRSSTDRQKASADRKLEDARARFDEAYERSSEDFADSIREERKASYDRFGRLNAEHAKEKSRDNSVKAKQLLDAAEANKHDSKNSRDEYERSIKESRNKFENDKKELLSQYEAKVDKQNQLASENLARVNDEARERGDRNIRRSVDEFAKQKLGEKLRYEQTIKDNQAYQEDLKRAYSAREKQLVDDKGLTQQGAEDSSAKSYSEYRKKASDALIQAINDSNFITAQKERENADRLQLSEHEHQSKLQDMGSAFRRAESELKYKNEVEKDRNRLREASETRRHQQDTFLGGELMRQNNEKNFNTMRERHTEQLRDTEEKNIRDLQAFEQRAKKHATDSALHADLDIAQTNYNRQKEISDLTHRHGQDRHALIREYETRHGALEDLRSRQLEGQREYYETGIKDVKREAQTTIAKAARENQGRTFELSEQLKHRTTEMEAARKQDLDFQEQQTRERLKRLSETYSKALGQQKENFDEATESYKHDTTLRVNKMRGDNDHEHRMSLLEMQAKNRNLMIAFDSKINQIKDEHLAEKKKLLSDNEKAIRESLRKSREAMDAERVLHAREMDIKDSQMKEKLRSQEEAFKEQIEKLKRTNELALKKS